jgi:acyl transferase domain-containing protein/NAD(P)H-dependent flavin oxidoreductase YrpB (nitropropane dioxygenase family)/NAD(P)-dependent dehydrogenase (short-subunit alcohol dehydrogenase family)
VTKFNVPRILALAPKGPEGIAVVAAACRASALGMLDTLSDGWEAVNRIDQLGRLVSRPFGLRMSSRSVLEDRDILNDAKYLGLVCIPVASDHENLSPFEEAVNLVLRRGQQVLAETTSRAEVRRAVAAGVSGVIVAGQEAGCRCGSDSSFVLLQAALAEGARAVWVRGGVGERVAAGAVAAGAVGVVLDGALLLARESPIGERWRERIERWDGSETTVVAPAAGPGVRLFAPPGSTAIARLREAAESRGAAWESALRGTVGWAEGQCPPVGQDAALAARLARKYVTVGGIVQAVERSIAEGIAAARTARPLAGGSPLAIELGTRYPILQGPMTRVSDVAPFAEAVARDGGLPFVALAMLRGDDVRALLRETASRLAGRPWGVGILGFVPPELRAEQLEAVGEVRPPWALIAGGRPDQAVGLERQGIRTFLHVPSPGLLEQYLRDGSRRFVLEGRECGGHVGPRSSFVLWEQAAAVIADAVDHGLPPGEISLVFAGGIHDARSGAMVAALAGPLAARGVKVGVLAGTAYLFTREAVETGAIVHRFQQEAIRCGETVLLESGPGHQVRVSPSPFVARFNEERRRLIAEGRPPEEVRDALESLNVGRLRVAAKGIDRIDEAASLSPVDDAYQQANGLYMLGQAATLRGETTTIARLHREIAEDSSAYLDREIEGIDAAGGEDEIRPNPSDIAIIGMSAVFPGAADLSRFWSNTLRGVDAITEVPPDRWDWRLYYDPDPKAPDKIVSKWGGFLPDIAFDPLRFGMPPSSLPSIEPAQLLALEVVRGALGDAGYSERPFARERTAVVLGMGGGAAQLAMGYAFRSYLPMLDTVIPGGGRAAMEACRGHLPEWTEDSFPGFLLNVTAGRIANRLNLGGANYTVDAACGSSLAAAALAVRELETGAADMVILGGVDTVQNPFTYLAFSKTQAFSPRGRCRPFDAGANGIVISEGVAAVVLKRLADAERDGDRIYAVIKGVGASSDGRARGLTAPGIEGQVRAIERAYAKAGVSPATVGYVEAHGTGTALGDEVEFESLSRVFREAGAEARDCVVGSVKSLIGHTKCAAGLAGLINASLSLYHKVLPPTIGIEAPNPRLELRDGPFRLCTHAEPWLHVDDGRPRRAGVSAFGFGGTNFHAVLEEYDRNTAPAPASVLTDWPEELMVLEADDPAGLIATIDRLARPIEVGARPPLRELSHALIQARERRMRGAKPGPILAIVAGSHEDLIEQLRLARGAIAGGRPELDDPRGIFYAERPEWSGAPVAFLFPGQGAQAPGMLRELAVAFPEVRDAFEVFDRAVDADGGTAPGPLVFPPPAFDDGARERARRELARTDVAQPAIGAACIGMLRLLGALKLEPAMVGGHSYGELVALHAAGALEARDLAGLSLARGRLMIEAEHGAAGEMAAILAGPEEAERLVREVPEVQIANWNGPRQTVVAGPVEAVERVVELAAARGLSARRLPVSSAFHTPMVAGAREPFSRLASERLRRAAGRPVYSNIDAAPYPAEPPANAARLGDHLANPVRFADMIEAMYRDGARVFVEVGPGGILTGMVGSILRDRPHLAVSCDAPTSPGLSGLLRRLARLLIAGVPLRLGRLTEGRARRRLDLDRLPPGEFAEAPTPSTWLVNGSRARPYTAPEPTRLGTGHVLPLPATRSGTPGPIRPMGNGTLESAMTHDTPTAPDSPVSHAMPPAPPMAPRSASPQADPVLESFQKTMQVFLEVQKATMLAYLNGRAAGAAASPVVPSPSLAPAPSHVTSRLDYSHQNGDRSDPTHSGRPSDSDGAGGLKPGLAAHDGHLHSDGNGNGHATPSWRTGSRIAAPRRSPEPPGAGDFPHGGAPTTASPSVNGAKAPPPDRATITGRLLEIVRDRTGYPIETLGLDLDIEADLGIDSIKRVEVLGKLRDEFPTLKAPSDSAEAMDALARARTLSAIVDRMAAMVAAELRPVERPADRGSEAVPNPPPRAGEAPGAESTPKSAILESSIMESIHRDRARPPRVERRLLEAVEAPLPGDRRGLMPDGRVVVTDDGRGVAADLARRMREDGIAAECIGDRDRPVEWTSPASIEAAVDEVRSRGGIAGIVHAMPLSQAVPDDPHDAIWSDRIADAVKGLFLLARASAADLEAAAGAGGSCLIAATALGGRFGLPGGRGGPSFAPGQGGIAGLVKTLAREWPTVRCRVVDLAPDEPADVLAGRLADEVFAVDGWAEVGHHGGRRIRLRSIVSPLAAAAPAIELAPGEPVVVTGGARGITGLVAAELARAWRPTLLIVGTTPEPSEHEPDDLASLAGEAEIKAALHERLRRAGRPAGPTDIEAGYQSLRRAREVRANLEILRSAGAHVEYARADVRDPAALAGALGAWREQFGDPVGLIHGAGLIKDKLIRQKTPESFDRVLGTKVDGALNLIRVVRPEALKFTALFSSIAGRFGNVGQSDYAAANEVLNKLAQRLDRRWPGRVVSVIWGPWSGVGMVSQLEGHLGRRGLGMIAPEVGRTLLLDELRYGRKGDVEVVYTGGLGTLEDPLPIVHAEPMAEAIR